jgi:hypothetical protein
MWSNEQQQCVAIRALLRRVHLESLWAETGPTVRASELLMDGGGPMSHGEAVMLRIAFDLWNGGGKATVDDLLSVLDGGNLAAVGSLLIELSNARPDIDKWVVAMERHRDGPLVEAEPEKP